MNEDGRYRAAAYLRKRAGGMSAADIADRGGIPDAKTVRAFLDGDTWPWAKTRRLIEDAVGLEPGELDRAARGELDATDEDPVVAALKRSRLSRGDRAKVEALYFDLLDAEERGRTG